MVGGALLWKIYSILFREDILVLRSMASLVKIYEHVPIRVIMRRTGLPEGALYSSLRRLVDERLVTLHRFYRDIYRLTFSGLNIASLHGLLRRGLVSAVGERIGLSKESLMYLGRKDGEILAIKFHRIGVTSFRHVVRVRGYGLAFERLWWGARSVISAEMEHRALEMLSRIGARVPKPIGREYNALVTAYIDGVDLYRVRDLRDPLGVLEDILETVLRAYRDAGIIHGDLSPYNIMVTRDHDFERCYVIDWPQWIRAGDEKGLETLRRDLGYIAEFFSKRFGADVSAEDLVRRVVGDR